MTTTNKEAMPSAELRNNRLTKVRWLTLMLLLASETTAFHASPREPFAMLHRRDVRDTGTEFYGRNNHPRKTPTSTRLQFKDGIEDPTKESVVLPKWWNGFFNSQSDSVNEQESVDDYLEFLDRRYNRLHEENKKGPFSAMNWLMQGTPEEEEILASKQQKDDALYVLGVAGLASQKLLQKHPQLQDAKQDSDYSQPSNPASIQALDTIVASAENLTFGHLVIQRVLVPIVKALYFVQRQKRVFLDVQLRRVERYAANVTKRGVRSLLYAPVKITKSMIEFGGGKANIASTLALASAILILLRPLLQGMLSEGTVTP